MSSPKYVMWYSLVIWGILISFFVPVQAIFGFSFGIFAAALAKETIGYKGLLLYYCFFIPQNLINSYFISDQLSSSVKPFLTFLANDMNNPENAAEYINVANSPFLYAAFMILYICFWYVIPIWWFYGSRKLIKKLKLRERIGLIKQN